MNNELKKPQNKGLFVVFEGVDGAGKTSVIGMVGNFLNQALGPEIIRVTSENNEPIELFQCQGCIGHVVITREPGGSIFGEDIRNILFKHKAQMAPITEALLFAAQRHEHLQNKIIPALRSNKIVISDRFITSSLVYQGMNTDLGYQTVKTINDLATNGIKPDIIFYFDIDSATLTKRMIEKHRSGQTNSFDSQDELVTKTIENYKKVLTNYQDQCEHFYQINSGQDWEVRAQQITKIILHHWENR